MRRMSCIRLKAPAKVNLGLWVGDHRPDGFHEIVTIILPLELCDLVQVKLQHSGISVTTDSRQVPQGPANLAHKAAQAFFDAAGIQQGCSIRVRKRIPVGAGLGGGSSDAAAVLNGLNRLCGSPLSPTALARVGSSVGSDVPALLYGRTCVARGRGGRLRPVTLPAYRVLLHYPGYAVSTAWAYAGLDRARASRKKTVLPNRAHSPANPGDSFQGPGLTHTGFSPKILAFRLRQGELEKAAGLVTNSFEPLVFGRHPELARVKQALLSAGCFLASLSGSGSTVFGLMEAGRQDPMAALKRQGISCISTRTIQT